MSWLRKPLAVVIAVGVAVLLMLLLFGCKPGTARPGSDQQIPTRPGDRRIVLHIEDEDSTGAPIQRLVTIHVIGTDKAGRMMVPDQGGLGVPGPAVFTATTEDWVPIDPDAGAVQVTITATIFARVPGERLILRAFYGSRTGPEVAGSYREARNTSAGGVTRVLTTAPPIIVTIS